MVAMVGKKARYHWCTHFSTRDLRAVKVREDRQWQLEWDQERKQYDRDDEIPFLRSSGKRL
jgi:hypothetical protein